MWLTPEPLRRRIDLEAGHTQHITDAQGHVSPNGIKFAWLHTDMHVSHQTYWDQIKPWKLLLQMAATNFPSHFHPREEFRRTILWPIERSLCESRVSSEKARLRNGRGQENGSWCLNQCIRPGLKPSHIPTEWPFTEGSVGTVFCHWPVECWTQILEQTCVRVPQGNRPIYLQLSFSIARW